MGCTEELPDYRWTEIAGYTIKGCVFCEVAKSPAVFLYLKLHRFYQAGHLPFEGGLMAQPAPVMEALDIIEEISQWHQRTNSI